MEGANNEDYCPVIRASVEVVKVTREEIVSRPEKRSKIRSYPNLSEPVTVALVRFPSHGGIVHKTKGQVAIGDKVRVVFKEKSKRTGSILEFEYFEKVA